MHREILGLKYGDPRQGDHKESGQTLDDRRSNLRIVTRLENAWNRRLLMNSKTGLKNIVMEKRYRTFIARICVQGKRIYLGSFKTKEDAQQAVCDATQKYHGEFARL
jgi:hypothetical protein